MADNVVIGLSYRFNWLDQVVQGGAIQFLSLSIYQYWLPAACLIVTFGRVNTVLPRVQRVEFPGFDHLAADCDAHPERVAQEHRRFFINPQRNRVTWPSCLAEV